MYFLSNKVAIIFYPTTSPIIYINLCNNNYVKETTFHKKYCKKDCEDIDKNVLLLSIFKN